ncbi:MAG TPA: alpha/beta fold hydrolase [Chloroflexota bacterium]|jgi:pimeloyl-ACP methyl ester carboxylesterase
MTAHDTRPRVLIVPGLNGHPGLLMRQAPVLFPGWHSTAFNHHLDTAEGGVDGLAERALASLETDEEVFVCGESFGGTVALTLAHQHPDRVRGLILFSTFGWHPSNLARRGAAALAVWSFLGHRVNTPAYQAGRLVSVPTQLGLRFPADLFRDYIQRPRAHVAAYRAKAELSLSFDARPWLASITIPTFVLTGLWDPVVPVSAGRELARTMPGAELHQLPGGHLVHLVQSRRVGGLIQAWARDLH